LCVGRLRGRIEAFETPDQEGKRVARIGILTGGGDCPGLNAVIRAVVRKGVNQYGHAIVGYRDGWRGVLDGTTMDLTLETTSGILPRGGTILRSSRTNPFKEERGVERVKASLAAEKISALIAVGGEDTLGVAARLSSEDVNVVGVPKTIDNDLNATDFTFGFNTAVQICTDAIDRLHTTAESHNRVIVLEVMGRHAGWIATYAGIAGGATTILVPERPFDIEVVCEHIRHRHKKGHKSTIVVVAEGARPIEADKGDEDSAPGGVVVQDAPKDAFGHVRLGGIGVTLERQIEERTGFETRVTILGHIQRGGTPTAFDRVLATRFGIAAIDAVEERDYGKMVALQGTDIVRVPIGDAVGTLKTLDPTLYETAEVFFG
jgi:phosphofructokinase-like protein